MTNHKPTANFLVGSKHTGTDAGKCSRQRRSGRARTRRVMWPTAQGTYGTKGGRAGRRKSRPRFRPLTIYCLADWTVPVNLVKRVSGFKPIIAKRPPLLGRLRSLAAMSTYRHLPTWTTPDTAHSCRFPDDPLWWPGSICGRDRRARGSNLVQSPSIAGRPG